MECRPFPPTQGWVVIIAHFGPFMTSSLQSYLPGLRALAHTELSALYLSTRARDSRRRCHEKIWSKTLAFQSLGLKCTWCPCAKESCHVEAYPCRKVSMAPGQCPGLSTVLSEHPAGEGGTPVPIITEPKHFKESERQCSQSSALPCRKSWTN